ncbi:hypothetical protein BGX24_006276 [Mortierella sp. AD032]|nr:hypothetical protein BGX24_006276 [Mortierella sp. AD032]
MSTRRQSPTIPEDAIVPVAPITTDITATATATSVTSKRPSLSRSRGSSSSVHSVSSISSLNSLLTSPSTTTSAATTAGSSTAVLSNGSSSVSSTSTSSSTAFVPSTSNTSTYYPSFPYRNKSRTPSVSSTSTITQPIHSLLQTSQGILPKRHGSSASAAPTLSTATASSTTASLTPSSSSSSLSSSGSRSSSPPIPPKLTTTPPPFSATTTMNSATGTGTGVPPHPILVLEPINSGFALKSFELPDQTRIKIGRQTGVTTAPSPSNGYFDSKVLSRIHAEVWSDSGKVYIRDLKSSNGTFLNGRRLSAESIESDAFILNQNDSLEFGIDIMDEGGSLLHEKVACRIFISRLSYPTPGGSPQDSHAKLRSGSPPGSGSSTKTTTATTGTAGQSANIDLIISRLQGELTRSQEANANLGILKQGLGDLEKSIVVSSKEEGGSSIPSPKSPVASLPDVDAIDYKKLLDEHTQTHQEEMTKLNKSLDDTQAELDAYIQKTQLLEPLVAEDEILRRDIAQSIAELSKVRLERDLAKDSMSEIINEHQQSLEALRKEQEAIFAVLEATHKENMERLAREASQAQELLTIKFQEELAIALRSVATPAPVEPEPVQLVDTSALEKELALLQESVEKQAKQIRELQEEKGTVSLALTEAKGEIVRTAQALTEAKSEIAETAKELKEVQERASREELASMTPTLAVSTSSTALSHHQNGHASTTTTTAVSTAASSTQISNGNVSKYEYTWSQFVFPGNRKGQHHLKQPSTVLMSSGVMLVGIGAYVFLRKSS